LAQAVLDQDMVSVGLSVVVSGRKSCGISLCGLIFQWLLQRMARRRKAKSNVAIV
jgi:hypothetical protein